MAAPLPVLGFREWVVARGGLVSSIRGEPWPVAAVQATCEMGHRAPADDCRCGIYAIEGWPRLGGDRLYEEAAAPMPPRAPRLLTAGLPPRGAAPVRPGPPAGPPRRRGPGVFARDRDGARRRP